MHLLRYMVSTHGWQALLTLSVLRVLSQVSSQLFMHIHARFLHCHVRDIYQKLIAYQ